jgi:hypothetical protein
VLEVTLPPLSTTNMPGTGKPAKPWSNPVSDISFGPAGQMLLAERSMNGDINTPYAAHESRLLEYTKATSTSPWANVDPEKFGIGVAHPWTIANGSRPSSAGGTDYDFAVPGLVAVTGDALHFPGYPQPPNVGTPYVDYIYGLQLFQQTNVHHTILDSVLIDLTGDTTVANKNQVGDVEISCPPPESCSAVVKEIICKKGDGTGYTMSLQVTNNSGQPAIDVLLATAPGSSYTVAPVHGGPVADHASINIPVTITGGKPGTKACFTITLMGEDGCLCTIEVCPVLPDCCALLSNEGTKVECNKDGTYTYTTTITNNSGSPKYFIYLYPTTPGATMTPDHFTITQPGGLAAGSVFQTPPITISGAKPGEFCFNISLHNKGMEGCCISPRHCITLLPCDKQPKRPR